MSKARQTTLLLAVLALALCAGVVSTAVAAEQDEPVKSREDVLRTLPCFECHSLKKYMSPPSPGIFSHELHGMFDLHCTSCHEISGHEMPMLKGAACASCHSMSVIEYTGGGMGKVKFNHETHGAMFSCSKCHPDVFPMKKGGAKMTMDAMYKGKSCGSCHNGRMAFASQDCMKCHKMG